MPILSNIGRKTPKVQWLIRGMYALLIFGGVTMVYPLMVMVVGSFNGTFDEYDANIVPWFLFDDERCFQRYLESKYQDSRNQGLMALNDSWNADYHFWREIKEPFPHSEVALDDFNEFRSRGDLPPEWYLLGHSGIGASNFRKFKEELMVESGGDLRKLGRQIGTPVKSWHDVRPREIPPLRLMVRSDGLRSRTEAFKVRCDPKDWIFFNIHSEWKKWNKLHSSGNLEKYNESHLLKVQHWNEIRFPFQTPNALPEKEVWECFIRTRLPLEFIAFKPEALVPYQQFLKEKYLPVGGLETLNAEYLTLYSSFSEIPIPSRQMWQGPCYQDYSEFIRNKVSLDQMVIECPEKKWADFLATKYQHRWSVAAAAHGIMVSQGGFEDIPMPIARMDWRDFQKNKWSLKYEFLTRNYLYSIGYMARHGNAVWNTFILCFLAVATSLIFNPMAAFALSRFKLPLAYSFLLFFIATVAFPAEVLMIPTFLQLKEMGLLNTFASLILPGLVNGYSIFLLKGYFDGIPREYYEAAVMDGAGEFHIFCRITLPLAKPILAVNMLASFTAAYSAFFFALIFCPDEGMWTVMVWLHQLQQTSGSQSINYAALCLTALPSLIIFLFCQRLILRSSVLPVET